MRQAVCRPTTSAQLELEAGAESSFDARRAAPLLLSQVAAPHALRWLRHGYTGCASVRSVCQRNGCAKVVMRCLENRRRELSDPSILRSLLAMWA